MATGTIPKSKTITTAYANGTVIASRTGNVVTIQFKDPGNITYESGKWITKATLDEIYRPLTTIDGSILNNKINTSSISASMCAQVRISPMTGDAMVYAYNSDCQVLGCVTYIV